jgi:hypothetical protein
MGLTLRKNLNRKLTIQEMDSNFEYLEELAENSSTQTSYKVYTALLTQEGENDPVATILENTLDFTITWTYNGIGNYDGISSEAFDKNKTFIIIGKGQSSSPVFAIVSLDNQSIKIRTYDDSLEDSDNVLLYTPIEIRIYN